MWKPPTNLQLLTLFVTIPHSIPSHITVHSSLRPPTIPKEQILGPIWEQTPYMHLHKITIIKGNQHHPSFTDLLWFTPNSAPWHYHIIILPHTHFRGSRLTDHLEITWITSLSLKCKWIRPYWRFLIYCCMLHQPVYISPFKCAFQMMWPTFSVDKEQGSVCPQVMTAHL